MAEPRSYAEIIGNGYVLGRDFRVAFGDSRIERCLLIAPHGGGIEPGTSEIMRTVADAGGWAWYEFAGFLRHGNQEALHIASTDFDEPTLARLLSQTGFVITFHGIHEPGEPRVRVAGKWKLGRLAVTESINAAFAEHGVRAVDVLGEASRGNARGSEDTNITNRGRRGEGIQLEFSRAARNLLFPPDCSREARGRRSAQLRPLAAAIHAAAKHLSEIVR